jgi:hypothetical protein
MKFKEYLQEATIEKLIGSLKGEFKSIKEVKNSKEFKKLSDADKEYVIDELKADGFK